MPDDVLSYRIDMSEINAALPQMIAQSKKELRDILVDDVARPLLGKIISLTPPAKGKMSASAKRAGLKRVDGDYNKAFREMDDTFIRRMAHVAYRTRDVDGKQATRFIDRVTNYVAGKNTAALNNIFRCLKWPRLFQPELTPSFLKSQRDPRTGRMKRDARHAVAPGTLRDVRNKARQHVGELAAGWNPAAAALNVSVPSWIGAGHQNSGYVVMNLEGDDLRIWIANSVRYADNVEGLRERVQTAVDWQARNMARRIDAFAGKDRRL